MTDDNLDYEISASWVSLKTKEPLDFPAGSEFSFCLESHGKTQLPWKLPNLPGKVISREFSIWRERRLRADNKFHEERVCIPGGGEDFVRRNTPDIRISEY